ncbi:MAG: A/G-specific adenine glycosylase [Thermomicrobiales bacterium]
MTAGIDVHGDRERRIAFVRDGLLGWFRANRRDLPWRRTRDPYRILVSEIMLQQTQVDRVLPHYTRFLDRFPTVEALAAAPAGDVITAWAGLGYNRRAVNLQRTAQAVVSERGGAFPQTVEELRTLPGVGPYTAGAIACFAFEQDAAFIDTNMRRVIHRLFFGVDVPATIVPEKTIVEMARLLVPPGNGWEWNQGLIEFGALQCTSRKPACVVCPLQTGCAAFPAIQSAIASRPAGSRRKREAPFAESNRFYRGRVVAALRDLAALGEPDVPLAELGPRVREGFAAEHMPWLDGVVQGLVKDGLASVAESPAAYDSCENDVESAIRRVRLP